MIIVVGSINMDIVTMPDGSVLHVPGGKSFNQAVAAYRLGGGVTFVGNVGDDDYGKQLLDFLRGEGLSAKHIRVIKGEPSGIAQIKVDKYGQNKIDYTPGANWQLNIRDVDRLVINKSDIIVASLEVPQDVLMELFRKAKNIEATTILNAAPIVDVKKGLFELTDYLIVNETELAHYSDKPFAKEMTRVFESISALEQFPEQVVIATLGDRGVAYGKDEIMLSIPAQDVDVIDTTGAGDCFVGAFAVGLAEGRDLQTAIEFANLASSIAVSRVGASSSLPIRTEVDSLETELLASNPH